jgi:hypothetical protein
LHHHHVCNLFVFINLFILINISCRIYKHIYDLHTKFYVLSSSNCPSNKNVCSRHFVAFHSM